MQGISPPKFHQVNETTGRQVLPGLGNRIHPFASGSVDPSDPAKPFWSKCYANRCETGYDLVVITNDIYTKEDQRLLTIAGALPAERILGVETQSAKVVI
jgi:urease accessory protein